MLNYNVHDPLLQIALGRTEHECGVKALLEDPDVLVVLKQKNIHYALQEVLEDLHSLGIEISNTLN